MRSPFGFGGMALYLFLASDVAASGFFVWRHSHVFLSDAFVVRASVAPGTVAFVGAKNSYGFPLFAEGQIGALYPTHPFLYGLLPIDVATNYDILFSLAWIAVGMTVYPHPGDASWGCIPRCICVCQWRIYHSTLGAHERVGNGVVVAVVIVGGKNTNAKPTRKSVGAGLRYLDYSAGFSCLAGTRNLRC